MALTAVPFSLDLGPSVKSAGVATADHEAVIHELSGLAPPGLPERAVAKRRAEFLAGRWAAREALAALGIRGIPSRNEDGSPLWPAQVAGSITHGADRALCAVADVSHLRSLGIDAERLMDESASAELRARICAEEERVVLQRHLERADHDLVTLAFSAKESLYKCLYPLVGKFMDFHAARVVLAKAEVTSIGLRGALTLELAVDWSPALPGGTRLEAAFLVADQHVETAVLLPA